MQQRDAKYHISTFKNDGGKSTYDKLAEITAYHAGKCNILFITVIILGGLSNLITNKSNQKLRNEYVNYAKTRGAEYENRNRKSLNVS